MTATSSGVAATLPLAPSDEERSIREAVRGICSGFGEHYSREIWEKGEPPRELWEALAEKGFVGANVPEEWGGGGMGMTGLIWVAEECGAAGAQLLMLVVSPAMTGSILARHGTDEQKQRWLRGIAAGTTRVAFAITEPDAGTNSHNLRTELRRDGDRYLLTGQKVFISAVEDADALLVVARLRGHDGNLGQLCMCIVDVDAPGFTRDVIPMPYLGPDRQWQLFFEHVEVEPERLIGGERGGLAAVFDGLNPERIILAAFATGTGLRALDKASAYARERRVWGAPIGAHQAVAHPLAKAKVELELARLMVQKAAALQDSGAPGTGEAANFAKYAAAEAGIHCVDVALQAHGGNGFTLEYGVSELWWGARLLRTAPVSAEMILNYVAQHSLGLPRSY
ncbi:MAG: acyl-CoA/acyl-ACP dehydrogenase [Solirubrobacterales bacterium]|nr:acyl-CoA/acyl-ACP dehydrogenase [Solirubrobacterales bacterium]